jgi:hypothetical protein
MPGGRETAALIDDDVAGDDASPRLIGGVT